jgi:ribosomal protein S18 acetylase RimI-like enzyme
MVRELADYEKALDQAQMTADQLAALLFHGTDAAPGTTAATPTGSPAAYCHVVDDPTGAGLAGFALWCLNVSTWNGRHGIYLEDLYVRPAHRGSGYGRDLLRALAAICVERGYQRFEWSVLDWNTPAIGFYRSIGAVGMDEWTVQRVDGAALADLAGGA